nr:unnamed protein product [Spirometra erinaceieuropaei]
MVSFDITSDFTSILQDLAVETIELLLREKYDKTGNRLGQAQIIQILKFYPKTYLTFDGAIYEQVKGTPMSSLISGLIAEAALQRLEQQVFRHHRPKFWARHDLAVETIELLLREKYDKTGNRLGQAQIIQILKFYPKTYLTFDGAIYEQVKGTPMSSLISGLIAEAALQRLEPQVFRHQRPKFWARHVGDTFVAIEQDQVLTFKEHLNTVFSDIQFTVEEK